MWTIKYRGCYIHGYFDRDACRVQIGHEVIQAKTLIGAKRIIRKVRP